MVALDLLSGISVLAAALLFRSAAVYHMDVAAVGTLLVVLSVLGAFESPTVQACVPQMQTGDNIIKGNAAVNQVVYGGRDRAGHVFDDDLLFPDGWIGMFYQAGVSRTGEKRKDRNDRAGGF